MSSGAALAATNAALGGDPLVGVGKVLAIDVFQKPSGGWAPSTVLHTCCVEMQAELATLRDLVRECQMPPPDEICIDVTLTQSASSHKIAVGFLGGKSRRVFSRCPRLLKPSQAKLLVVVCSHRFGRFELDRQRLGRAPRQKHRRCDILRAQPQTDWFRVRWPNVDRWTRSSQIPKRQTWRSLNFPAFSLWCGKLPLQRGGALLNDSTTIAFRQSPPSPLLHHNWCLRHWRFGPSAPVCYEGHEELRCRLSPSEGGRANVLG